MAITTVHLGKRVYYRNEDVPLRKAMNRLGWKEEKRPEKATIIWDVETLADTGYATELQPHQLVNRIPIMIHCCR